MADLLIARHAETPWNEPGHERLRGNTDVPLTAKGRHEAVVLAKEAKRLGAVRVAGDDTRRVRLTADAVSLVLDTPPITDPRLRPWDIGAYEGHPQEEYWPILERFIGQPLRQIPGGERYQDFFDRWTAAFWDYLDRARRGEHWLLVVHSGNFATLDDVRLARGITVGRDYEPANGKVFAVNADDFGVPKVREVT